jgi:isopenicillin-N epimerase
LMNLPLVPAEPNVLQSTSVDWKQLWSLDPSITFLNHGSFGACPIAVLEQQQALRQQLEAEPVRFFARELEPLLDAARMELAQFVGADPENLAFVPNATTGVNTILRSLSLQPGDELLTTNHEYNACRNALNAIAAQTGAQVVVAEVPFPLESAEQVIEAVLSRVSAKTKLLLIDHVSSQTALVMPIEAIAKTLSAQGIDTLVDGAHAPGMVPLDLESMGVTYYTANCHKWLCAPKGAAFLYVKRERRSHIRPLVISHGANSPRTDRSFFRLEFDWTGTADPTPFLCVPEAIRVMGSLLPGGWPELMQQNRTKALAARQILCNALKVEPPCPDSMIGSMATVPLPSGSVETLYDALCHHYQIEVPVIPWHPAPTRLLRVSAQLYNTLAEYDQLASALVTLLAAE